MRLFSLFLLLGTLIIQWILVVIIWEIILVALLLCAIAIVLFKRKAAIANTLLISIFPFLLGLCWASFQASQIIDNRITPDLEGKDLIVQGVITDIPNVKDDGVRFLLDVAKASIGDKPNKAIKLEGLIRLGWFRNAEEINAGESWQLKVRLKRPSGFMNPGGFDYEKWLFTQKIIATGYIRSAKPEDRSANHLLHNEVSKSTSAVSSTSISSTSISSFSISTMFDRWRQNIHQTIQERVDDKPSAAVLSSLLVAIRTDLDDKQWELLQATGTSHLVAISGLHIAVVAGFAFFPMMFLWRCFPRLNERVPLRVAAAVVGTLFALGYAMLAGLTLPTQRALLMVIIVLWGLVSRRNYDSSTVFSFALVLVLLWDPLAPMTVSFWLSFLAVFLILVFIKRQMAKPKWMVLKLQLFLSLSMLPLTVLFFGTASLTSPVANLFAIPWVSLLIVPISLLALAFMPVSSLVSDFLLKIASIAIEVLFKVLEVLAESSLSAINLSQLPDALLIVAFLGVLTLMLPKGFPARGLGILLIAPALIYQTDKLEHGEFTYTMLDVGQGYGSVLQTRNHSLVYDTGTRVSESFDLGKLVMVPYLKAKGIQRLDMMMISHGDIDHRGGAAYLQDNFEIDQVFTSDVKRGKSIRAAFNKLSLEGGELCIKGQTWQWDGVNFEVLSPHSDLMASANDRSCVLKVWNQHHTLLLSGDIQRRTEKALVKSDPDKIQADVLSVPHHGSKTSSTIEFLEQVSPSIALVSAGYRSRFGHPHPSIVKRYQDLDVEILDTVNHGAINLHFPADDQAIKRRYHRNEKRGFWSR